MREHLDRSWRVVATGFCFAFFFIGALIMSVSCLPVIYSRPISRLEKTRQTRRMVRRVFRLFVAMMETFGLIRVSVVNRQRLEQAGGCLVIANHPTLIDVVILFSIIPQANCVVKDDLWHSACLRWVMRATGFISNENGSNLLEGCQQALANGDAIVIFPEGSRTVPHAGLQFKRGVANIAVRTNAPIVPVLIRCEPLTLMKGEPWYRIPPRRADITLTVEDRLQPSQVIDRFDDKPAAARLLTRYLQAYFEKGLESFYERYYQPDQTDDYRRAGA